AQKSKGRFPGRQLGCGRVLPFDGSRCCRGYWHGLACVQDKCGGGIGKLLMRWFIAVLVILLIALILDSGLLAYSMYVLLGVLLLTRFLARSWIGHLSATRKCNKATANIGDKVSVQVVVSNSGSLPVPWVLLEDLLPRFALDRRFPRL